MTAQTGTRRGARRRWAAVVSVLGAVLVVALTWRLAGDSCAAVRPAATSPGKATFYDLAGDVGACNFRPPADDLYVALSPSQFDAAGACGGYYDVTGPRGTVRVKVFDQCPECERGHLDLSRTAFSRIGTTSHGLVDIRYRHVANPAGHGRLTIQVAEGSSRYWIALVVEEAGNGLTKVEIRGPGRSWQSLRHEDFNYWTADSGAGPGPFAVRVTDDQGHRVTATGVDLRPEVLQPTSARLYGPGSTVATAPEAGEATKQPSTAKATPRATPSTEPAAATVAAPASPPPSGAAVSPPPESVAYDSSASLVTGTC
jgi:expansin (peptidoglycan-binding protein)